MLRVILPTKASGHGCRSGSAAFEQVIGPQQKLITIARRTVSLASSRRGNPNIARQRI